VKELTKVKFSNLNKILYPHLELTKGKVIKYYLKVAPLMLKFLKNRPLVTTRFPDGVDKKGFYEKNAPMGTPSWVKTFKHYSKTAKRNVNYVVCNNLDTLLWLANLAALEIHIPLSKIDSYEKPDMILFDIDPEPPADINDACEVAKVLREKLEAFSLKSYPKTSGKKGLHIVVPIVPEYSYDQTREFVHQVGKHLEKEIDIVVSEFSHSQEPGTVYIDYGQNSKGKTMICPYSLRATVNGSISFPLSWKKLEKGLKPENFNISTVLDSMPKDLWGNFWQTNQRLDVKKL